jgi:hypothetical protein
MPEHNTTQTRTEDMIQHIRLLDNALSMNLYHTAKTWLNHVLEDMEVLEAEVEFIYVLNK